MFRFKNRKMYVFIIINVNYYKKSFENNTMACTYVLLLVYDMSVKIQKLSELLSR